MMLRSLVGARRRQWHQRKQLSFANHTTEAQDATQNRAGTAHAADPAAKGTCQGFRVHGLRL